MKRFSIFQVDAFTDKIFGGNPACVVEVDMWPSDEVMKSIAKENCVAETAFYIKSGERFKLRWFTPDIEMDLCGHATLATAHVIFNHQEFQGQKIIFESLSGELVVTKESDLYVMDFPIRDPRPATLPEVIAESLNIQPQETLLARDYVLIYKTQKEIEDLKPNKTLMDRINLDPGGVVVTAKGDSVDFVSRFFTPQATIFEDPVTGSAHCSLVPLWARRLNKNKLHALQLSERVGELFCEQKTDRVLIKGRAKTFLEGRIFI